MGVRGAGAQAGAPFSFAAIFIEGKRSEMTSILKGILVSAPAPSGEGGTGIALYNVDGRLKAVFGKESGVSVKSEVGAGTTVTLLLQGAMSNLEDADDDDWDEDPD